MQVEKRVKELVEEKIADRQRRSAGEKFKPLPSLVSDVMTPEMVDRLSFSKVQMRGRFLHSGELHVYGWRMKNSPGFHVITPFLRTDMQGSPRQVLVFSIL